MAAVVLTLFVLFVFWPVTKADFVEWDDGSLIYENKYYKPVTAENILRFWKQPLHQLYTPVTYTVWAMLAVLARVPQADGLQVSSLTTDFDPRIFHSFSLLLHLLSTLVVWGLLSRLFKSGWAACAGALLWALHPLQVEPVAWAAELKGILAGFFGLCALSLYVMAHSPDKDSQGNSRFYVAAALCYLLALLSKPSAVCLSLIAWCLDFFLLRRNAKRATLSLLPWVLLALPFVLAARSAQPVPSEISPLYGRPFVAGDALAFYIRKFVFPDTLEMIYMRTPRYVLSHWWGFATWLVPVVVGILAWRARRAFPVAPAAFAVFVAALLPNLGLAAFIYQRHSTVADRYAYLALLAPAMLLTAWLARGSTPAFNRRVVFGLCAVWLALLGVRSALHVPNWRNSLALWTYNVQANPNNWALINNIGVNALEAGNFVESLRLLRMAAQGNPQSPTFQCALGLVMARQKRWEEAKTYFHRTLELDPKYARATLGLANIAREQGQEDEALKYYHQALQTSEYSSGFDPQDVADARFNIGTILSKRSRLTEAVRQFRLALQLMPDDAAIHDGLALALARQSQMEQAEAHWQKAVELDPKFAAARINLGTLLAMQNRLDEASAHWQEALRLLPDSAPEKASAHHNLAIVLNTDGHQGEAVAHWRAALKLRPNYPAARAALARALKTEPAAAR